MRKKLIIMCLISLSLTACAHHTEVMRGMVKPPKHKMQLVIKDGKPAFVTASRDSNIDYN